MFTSNSNLAPDARKRRRIVKDTLAELWKAESFMESRKIKGDVEQINWFVRGSPDSVIRWFMKVQKEIKVWKNFKLEYIIEFGSEEQKLHTYKNLKQGDRAIGEYTRYNLRLVEHLLEESSQNISHNIITCMNEGEEKTEIVERMKRKPKNMPHWVWLEKIIERMNRKKIAIEKKKILKKDEILPVKQIGMDTKEEKEQQKADKPIVKEKAIKPKTLPHKEESGMESKNNIGKTKEFKLLEILKTSYPKATNNDLKMRQPCTLCVCEINTTEGKRVCVPGQRRVPQSMIERTKDQLDKLENTGIISKSKSEWRSPVRPVEKTDGTVRICTNLIALNELVIKEDYPTPIMNDLIEKLQGSTVFTGIDLKDGYFQIEVKKEHRYKTAFKFDNRLYEWNRMPMGYKNAPSIFQKTMDKLLGDLSGTGVEVYLDDIVVHGKTQDSHDQLLFEVFKRLEDNNLCINTKKLQLAKSEKKLLGILVNGKTQKLTQESRNDIVNYPRPTDTKSLRRFLGKMNFFSAFIEDVRVISNEIKEEDKIEIIRNIHEKLIHRGLVPVKYELEKQFKWPKAAQLIEKVISTCEVCSKNNRKLGGGSEFVITSEPLEKTAIDIMKISEDESVVLVFIDYYTRKLKIKLVESRTTQNIILALKSIFNEIGTPKELNTDNAKEFVAKEFLNFCTDLNIVQHLTSVEKHKSNGRVERSIRTIRDGLAKSKELNKSIEERLQMIENAYNNTFHSGIGMTPEEAMQNEESKLGKGKIIREKYLKQFKIRKREKFVVRQQVRIANKENLKIKGKSYDRFQERGVITHIAGNDSYVVKDEAGKRYKISHSDLKAIDMA